MPISCRHLMVIVHSIRLRINSFLYLPQRVIRGASAMCLLALAMPVFATNGELLSPSPHFTPQQVVKIVVEALGSNGTSGSDAGIATVYRFASPGNRSNTGPLPRFTSMIKRGFPEMLDHAGSRYDTMEVTGNTAVQAVWLVTRTGEEVGYAFQVGKQSTGEYKDMWMTEAVIPLGSRKEGTGI